MDNCKFCQIINRQISSWIVYENEKIIAFLPEQLEVYGHTLIAPKQHYEDLYDAPEDVLCELVKVSKKITIAYKDKISATGMNLMHASGVDGQQSVFHFHIHLLPRFKDDKLDTWPNLPKIETNKNELLEKLRFD
ncbi:HIT domain-containing protein [Candidatus Atribacteria bacterium 1244-E10-H5-B2]|nr:MAG: HIT domain-containing protein [Candidatus Atribacteria bacterium 1244-E10-H5-B2]